MAYGGPSRQKDNFNRFQKQATINITKYLREIAKKTQTNVEDVAAKQLKETYINNVLASYGPRSKYGEKNPYEHTGIFIENIDVVKEVDPGIGRDRVKIVLDKNKRYPNSPTGKQGKTVGQVYEYLTEGTKGSLYRSSGNYIYRAKYGTGVAHNYSTPAHLFEQHTQLQMKGFLVSLSHDIEKGKYSK